MEMNMWYEVDRVYNETLVKRPTLKYCTTKSRIYQQLKSCK